MKKLILFDLDGTLLDTLEDLGEAVNHALGLRGLGPLPLEDYRQMVGHGVRNLVAQALEAALGKTPDQVGGDERAVGDADRAAGGVDRAVGNVVMPGSDRTSIVDAALDDFRAYYEAHIDVHTRPYAGIPELLGALQERGIVMAVASNKFQEGTEYLVRRFFPDIHFVAIMGNRPGWPLKPAPEIAVQVLSRAGVDAADAMMVGDSPTDMRTAFNGGIDALAVTWGYRTSDELAAACPGVRLVHSVPSLRIELLEKYLRGREVQLI